MRHNLYKVYRVDAILNSGDAARLKLPALFRSGFCRLLASDISISTAIRCHVKGAATHTTPGILLLSLPAALSVSSFLFTATWVFQLPLIFLAATRSLPPRSRLVPRSDAGRGIKLNLMLLADVCVFSCVSLLLIFPCLLPEWPLSCT